MKKIKSMNKLILVYISLICFNFRNRPQRSMVWDFVTKVDAATSSCNLCQAIIATHGKTTNARSNLQLHHKRLFDKAIKSKCKSNKGVDFVGDTESTTLLHKRVTFQIMSNLKIQNSFKLLLRKLMELIHPLLLSINKYK